MKILPLLSDSRRRRPVLAGLLVLLAVAGSGCEKIKQILTFKISDSSTVTLPPVPPGSYPLPGTPIVSTSTDTYKSNNTSASFVQDVTLDKLTLTITAPAGQNFDFLKSISIAIASDAAGTDRVALAALTTVPKGQTTISLTPAGNKLDLFLRNGTYTLFSTAELTTAITQPLTLRTDAVYNVSARQP